MSVEEWFEQFGLKDEFQALSQRPNSPVHYDSFEDLLNDIPGDTRPFTEKECTILHATEKTTRREILPIPEQDFRRVFTFQSPAEDKFGMLKFQMKEVPKPIPRGKPSHSSTSTTTLGDYICVLRWFGYVPVCLVAFVTI
eukprot:m.19715 g.19715  ORF g.19715 m.19715 type:complete len:140 (-) comp8497_c0_seq7:459-878(-)